MADQAILMELNLNTQKAINALTELLTKNESTVSKISNSLEKLSSKYTQNIKKVSVASMVAANVIGSAITKSMSMISSLSTRLLMLPKSISEGNRSLIEFNKLTGLSTSKIQELNNISQEFGLGSQESTVSDIQNKLKNTNIGLQVGTNDPFEAINKVQQGLRSQDPYTKMIATNIGKELGISEQLLKVLSKPEKDLANAKNKQIISDVDLAKQRKFLEVQDKLSTAFNQIKNKIAGALLPTFIKMTNKLTKFINSKDFEKIINVLELAVNNLYVILYYIGKKLLEIFGNLYDKYNKAIENQKTGQSNINLLSESTQQERLIYSKNNYNPDESNKIQSKFFTPEERAEKIKAFNESHKVINNNTINLEVQVDKSGEVKVSTPNNKSTVINTSVKNSPGQLNKR